MKTRLDWKKASPLALGAMSKVAEYVGRSGLEESLLNLVRIRASQLNGCAHCIDMHTKDARVRGESEQRLYAIAAWREAPFFTQRERAALAWAEAVTLVAETHVPDEVYEEARKQFGEKELVDLTLATVLINGWNRFNVSFRTIAGSYKPQVSQKAHVTAKT